MVAGPPLPAGSATGGQIRARGADPGADWQAQLFQWWRTHSYYPRQAAENDEDGTVVIHVLVGPSGKVQLVDLLGRSGSRWLDMGAQAVFRGATVPPLPPDFPDHEADLEITINYVLIRR
jgi:protein TonB